MDEGRREPRLVHVIADPWALYFIRGQARFMRQVGFDVTTITSAGPALDAFGARERVKTRSIEMKRAIVPFTDVKSVLSLVRFLRSTRPGIVHAHTPKGGLLGMIAAWLVRVPIRIYHIRGLPYMTATGRRRQLLRLTEKVSCRLATRVFCVSDSVRRVAVEDAICPPEKITVFLGGSGNGVDAAERLDPERWPPVDRQRVREGLGLSDSALVVSYIGRLAVDKGVRELAAAWRTIRNRFPAARLIVVGGPDARDPIDVRTQRELDDDDRVVMLGDSTPEDVADVYAISDVVVLPTYREGFPNVPLEAAAMSLPVVATRVPGCIDAVADGETGTLVPPRDAESLAAAVTRYLDEPELRCRHGRAGRERVLRAFRQEDIWEAVYQEYCRLLSEVGQPGPTQP